MTCRFSWQQVKTRYADNCSFMQSLRWVDTTYVQKHKKDDPKELRAMYYPNLVMYSTKGPSGPSKPLPQALAAFAKRYGRKVGMWVGIYLLSLLPVVGRFVMPAASFYAFRKSVGTVPAAVIFGSGIFLPRKLLVTFLHSYFASRSLMRELVSQLSHSYPLAAHSELSTSSSLIFPVSNSIRSKNVDGFSTAKVYCLVLPSASRSLSGRHSSEYSCMVLLKPRQLT